MVKLKVKNKKGLIMEGMMSVLLWVIFLLIAGFAIYLAVRALFFKSVA